MQGAGQSEQAGTAASRMNYFMLLTPEQQQKSIRRLSRSGMGDYSIAAATGLAVEQVRRVIWEPESSAAEQVEE